MSYRATPDPGIPRFCLPATGQTPRSGPVTVTPARVTLPPTRGPDRLRRVARARAASDGAPCAHPSVGNLIVGWLLIPVGLSLTLSLSFPIFGLPMMTIGAGMIGGGGSGTVTQQMNILNYPVQEIIPIGTVRDRIASDERPYWYLMTDEEKRDHRIASLESYLGL